MTQHEGRSHMPGMERLEPRAYLAAAGVLDQSFANGPRPVSASEASIA
jgi:hypothetical protein